MSARRRRTRIGRQFAWQTIDMLRSPAWRALSLSARRVIDRLEIELADHGGADNGKLPTTYDDFEQYGIHRHAIAPAIREAVALGFLEVTERGRAGNAEWRKPNLFRLTFRHVGNADPTDEWQRIKTDDYAKERALAAREAVPKKQNPSDGDRQTSVSETITETADSIVRNPPLQRTVRKPP